MARQINLRVSDDLLRAVDEDRGDVPRNRYIVRLLEGALGVPDRSFEPPSAAAVEVARRVEEMTGEPTEGKELLVPLKKGSEVSYRCQRCEFTAKVPSARCPRHPGKLVAG